MPSSKHPTFSFVLALFWSLLGLLGSPQKALAQVRTEIGVSTDSFISPDFEATQKTNYQFVGASIKTELTGRNALQMDIGGGVAVGAPLLNYLNISEFYFEDRKTDQETFYFGRKKMPWNMLDAQWNLGVWEPVFKWNPLSPERQGLVGIYWQKQEPTYSLVLFASPLFLPDQGPNFEIENGSFVRGSPWFRRPPESIRIWSEATQIDYQFDKPNESQIVLQNSFGLSLAADLTEKVRSQISYSYKPANQLAVGYDGNLNVAKLKGVVDLQPQVFYHSLLGLDLVYHSGAVVAGFSGLLDKSTKDNNFSEKWTHPIFEDALLLSPFVEWSQSGWAVNFKHLDILGGVVKEEGELADPRRAVLMARYPYQQAYEISVLRHSWLSKGRPLTGKFSYTQSYKNEFALVRLGAKYHWSRLWTVGADLQLIRAGAMSAGNQSEISQYVNNDRFMIGASYVF